MAPEESIIRQDCKELFQAVLIASFRDAPKEASLDKIAKETMKCLIR